jgi:hypothetical protein
MVEYLDTALAFVVAELAVAMAYMRELASRHDVEIIELKRRDEQIH